MTWVKLAALFVSVSVCWACSPIFRDDKTDYCFSDFAYEATIESKNVGELAIVYRINVGKVYKGNADNIPPVLKGFGTMNSCGPQDLDVGAKYLIYASTFSDEIPEILKYTEFAYVTEAHKNRMAEYDCNSKQN